MRKIFLIAFAVIPLIISCDDQVNPKSDFKSEYVLNCVIRSDTSHQFATLSHSFDVEGYDPYTNREDPFINNASIVITYKNTEYIMRDTTVARTDTSRYKGALKCFYLPNFQPKEYSKIKLDAYLLGGKTLHSESYVFEQSSIYMSVNGLPSRKFTSRNLIAGIISFSWGTLGNQDLNEAFFAPEIAIVYTKEVNNVKTKHLKKIPRTYVSQSNYLPIYPGIIVGSSSLNIDSTTINRAMMEISSGDTDKSSYTIENVVIRLLILDENLAAYYSAQQTFLNEFSLRSYQPDFTNIVGGLGLFGTYNFKSLVMEIDPDFAKSFGYSTP
ncbi:MAG: hypothetical protein AB1521_09430 [Bacteroidota bacterium]